MKRHTIPSLLLFTLLTLFVSACYADVGAANVSAASVASGASTASANTSGIYFAGKVTHRTTGIWMNDYEAIVYLDGQEVGRHTSETAEFTYSGHGVHKGLFQVRVPNTYRLTPDHNFVYDREFLEFLRMPGSSEHYIWLDELHPGDHVCIYIPEKQINYVVEISDVPTVALNSSVLNPGTARLENNRTIANQSNVGVGGLGGCTQNVTITPICQFETGCGGLPEFEVEVVPTPTPSCQTNNQCGNALENCDDRSSSTTNNCQSSDIRPETTMKLDTSEVSWTKVLTNFEGNRWEVWQQHVRGRVDGLVWETFYEQVLLYNPQLEADDYQFHAGKAYLIPEQK